MKPLPFPYSPGCLPKYFLTGHLASADCTHDAEKGVKSEAYYLFGVHTIMNTHAFAILLVPIMGLAAICRGGRFHKRVISSSALLNGVFWFGWTSTLVFGLWMLLHP